MNLRQLEAFRAVMVTGSISLAASSLNLSQPAVSKLISDLEHAIGFRLFVRSRGSSLVITPEAEAFHHEVERSFAGIEALKRAAREIKEMTSGTIRVAALPALAVSYLPRVVRAFRAAHPGVTVQLQTRSSSTVRQWVSNQQFDIGLATPAAQISGVQSEPFLKCPGACVLPPGHRLAAKRAISPEDLRGEPFISLALEDPTRRRVDRVFEDAGVDRNIVVETQYAMTICGLVLEGVGCSILNPITSADFAMRGLVVRPFEPLIEFQYVLYTPVHRPLSIAALRFLQTMRDVRDTMAKEGVFGEPLR